MTAPLCPTCGTPLDEHNRHIRFRLPEPVLGLSSDDLDSRTWGNDVLMQVEGIGAFVQVLLPIKLTGGFSVTYGAWVSVHPRDLRHAREVWEKPEYAKLQLVGALANKLPPWEEDTYLRPVEAKVLNLDHIPYAVGSRDKFMERILTLEWAHELVLLAISAIGNDRRA